MRLIMLLILLSSPFFSHSKNVLDLDEENSVIIITDDIYDYCVANLNFFLIEFWAPWCGHCKDFLPEYEKVAKHYQKINSELAVAKINVKENPRCIKENNLEGYPTVKLYIFGEAIEYLGGVFAEDMIKWIDKKIAPVYKTVKSSKELDELRSENEFVAVLFGNDKKIVEYFDQISRVYEKSFMVVADESLAAATGHEKDDIVFFKKDGSIEKFNQNHGINTELLMIFFEKSSLALVNDFNEDVADYIFSREKTGLFLFLDQEKHSEYEKILHDLALENRNIVFVVTGLSSELEKKLAQILGITEKDLPVVKLLSAKEVDVQKFTMKNEITKENISDFLVQFKYGELIPEYISEEIPQEDPSNAIIKLVGKNYLEKVKDYSKDYLVLLYSPFCEHSKKLLSKLENLANKLQQNKSLVIAKMDATINDIPGDFVESYPVLRFYSHQNKNPTDISKLRNEFKILDFLKKQNLVDQIDESISFEKDVEDDDEDEDEDEEEDEENKNKEKDDL